MLYHRRVVILVVSLLAILVSGVLNFTKNSCSLSYQKMICERELANIEALFSDISNMWLSERSGSDISCVSDNLDMLHERDAMVVLLEGDSALFCSSNLINSDSIYLGAANNGARYLKTRNHQFAICLESQEDREALLLVKLFGRSGYNNSFFSSQNITLSPLESSEGVTINDSNGVALFEVEKSNGSCDSLVGNILGLLGFSLLLWFLLTYFSGKYCGGYSLFYMTGILVGTVALLYIFKLSFEGYFPFALLFLIYTNHLYKNLRYRVAAKHTSSQRFRQWGYGLVLLTMVVSLVDYFAFQRIRFFTDLEILTPIFLAAGELNILFILFKFRGEVKRSLIWYTYLLSMLVIIATLLIYNLQLATIVLFVMISIAVVLALVGVNGRIAMLYVVALWCGGLIAYGFYHHCEGFVPLSIFNKEKVSLLDCAAVFVIAYFASLFFMMILMRGKLYGKESSAATQRIVLTMFTAFALIVVCAFGVTAFIISSIRDVAIKEYILSHSRNVAMIYDISNDELQGVKYSVNLYSPNGQLLRVFGDKEGDFTTPYRLSSDLIQRVATSKGSFVMEKSKRGYISSYGVVEDGNILHLVFNRSAMVNNFAVDAEKSIIIFLALLLILMVVVMLIYRKITIPLDLLSRNIKIMRSRGEIELSGVSKDSDIAKVLEQYNAMIKELEKQHSYMIVAERERTWNRMIKLVAHEIKNPLTPMMLKTELLLSQIERNREGWQQNVEPTLNVILEQCSRISQLIRNMADSPKEFLGDAHEVDIKQFFDQIEALFVETTNIDLSVDITLGDGASYNVYLRREMLFSAIINIVNNAFDAINESGQQDGKVKISTLVFKDRLEVKVWNNGPIIPSDKLGSIFNYQYTTKKDGHGVGLFFVEMLLGVSKGKISVTSDLDNGTVFTILVLL